MKTLLMILLFALAREGHAQLPDYYVYLVSGEATITNSKTKAKPLVVKQYQLVYNDDVITLKKGTEITFADKEANFWVFNTTGTYAVTDMIEKSAKEYYDGLTGKYLKLLFHELLDPNHDFEKFKKENIAGVWGGVSRQEGCGNLIFPINGLKTSVTSITFKWHSTSPSSNYAFVIYDGEANELTQMTVKDTLLYVDLKESLHGKAGKYFWRVTSADGTCEDEIPIYFDLLSRQSEMTQAAQLYSVTMSESLENQLQQIDKLEKNAFIHVASDRYRALINANPDNGALLKSYVSFLLKYGFDREAQMAWK